jgi:hypothetical protein
MQALRAYAGRSVSLSQHRFTTKPTVPRRRSAMATTAAASSAGSMPPKVAYQPSKQEFSVSLGGAGTKPLPRWKGGGSWQ